MTVDFEELDRRRTSMGEISVRRRLEPTLGVDVYEVKLGDEFLMSSLFTVAEVELARLGLAALDGDHLDVVVGGLGLGYTAQAVLEDPRVRSLRVVEALSEVIEWHERRLLPLSDALTSDPRCEVVEGDFFEMVANATVWGTEAGTRCHAMLVDIDHTPRHHLHPSHAPFYTERGLARLADQLHPGGVFGLWSDAPPDEEFMVATEAAFPSCEPHVVRFPNFYTGEQSAATVYVAKADPGHQQSDVAL